MKPLIQISIVIVGLVLFNFSSFAQNCNDGGRFLEYRGKGKDVVRSLSVNADSGYVYSVSQVVDSVEVVSDVNFFIPINSSTSGNSVVVTKQSSNGTVLWSKGFYGFSENQALGINHDNFGNVYITGYFYDQIIFGSTILTSSGFRDMFLVKLSNNGDVVWVKQGGGPMWEMGKALTISNNTIYITGYYQDNASFSGTILNSAGDTDLFVASYDLNGNLNWIKGFQGSNGKDEGFAITKDNNGYLYVSGFTEGNLNMDGINISSNGTRDVLAAKLSEVDGSVQWATSFGGSLWESSVSATFHHTDNALYIGGSWYSNNVNVANNIINSQGSADAFIAKINMSGVVQWMKIGGTMEWDAVTDLEVTENGDVLGVGMTGGAANIAFICGRYRRIIQNSPLNDSSILMMRVDPTGALTGLVEAGGQSDNLGQELEIKNSQLYICGEYTDGTVLGPDVMNARSGNDGFIWELCDTASLALPPVSEFLGNDTTICLSNCILLDAGLGGVSFNWSTDRQLSIPSQQRVLLCPELGVTNIFVEVELLSGLTVLDTIQITVIGTPISGLTSDTLVNTGSCVNLSIDSVVGSLNSWTDLGSSTVISNSTDAFVCPSSSAYYEVTQRVGVCSISDTVFIGINAPDSVWPGDADYNGIANNWDIIPIGLLYNNSGPLRPNATPTWIGQAAADWGAQFVNGADYKHTDCDGNGLINQDDIVPILLNYGLTHQKNNQKEPKPGSALLYVELLQDSVQAGDTATFIINLGVPLDPAQNIYALAFSVNYNSLLVQSGTFTSNYGNSWLGNKSLDMQTLDIELQSVSKFDMGLTRTDLIDRDGSGEIARINVVTIDNISGKDLKDMQMSLSISDVKAVNANNDVIELDTGSDTLTITNIQTSIIDNSFSEISLNVFPNPSNGQVFIELKGLRTNEAVQVEIFDLSGKQVLNEQYTGNTLTVPASSLNKGMYLIRVSKADKVIANGKVVKL